MKRISHAGISLLLMLPLAVQAHEGHGVGEGHEPGHYLLSPEHAVPAAITIALLVVLRLFWKEWKKSAQEAKH